MSIEYNFLLTGRNEVIVPHLLMLMQNQRTGKYSWSYHTIMGKVKDPKPKASGDDVRYAAGGSQFDLYATGRKFGTLTLTNKRLGTLITGDAGTFISFTGKIDDAKFTGKN